MSNIDRISIGRRIQSLLSKVAHVLFTRNMATFLVFLFLSLAFWFMRNVGTCRSMSYSLPIVYAGIPNNVRVDTELPSELTIAIRDEGQNLLTHYLWHPYDTIVVDMSSSFGGTSPTHVDFRTTREQIVANLPQTAQLIDIKPQFLNVEYGFLQHRVLPLRLLEEPKLQLQCVLRDTITIVPAMVDVYAPKEVFDTLKFVPITLPNAQPFSKSSEVECVIPLINSAKICVERAVVKVPVELSTEKQLVVNVEARNFPDSIRLRSFPASVKVTCVVGISQYNAISPEDFDVYVDYNDVKSASSDKAPLHLKNKKSILQSVHISPTEVEFLLEK